MLKKGILFLLLILTFSVFGQDQLVLDPSSFLKDKAFLPDFETAFLVTKSDTLISWNKQGNQTIAKYLETKITKTEWADSVEVCTQQGLMLEDFQEYCFRQSAKNGMLTESFKNVEQYLYFEYSGRDIQVLWKSYSKGVLKKGAIILEEKKDIISKSNFKIPKDNKVDLNNLLHSHDIESQEAKVIFSLISGVKTEAQANLNVDLLQDRDN